jgi:hypothetical protein
MRYAIRIPLVFAAGAAFCWTAFSMTAPAWLPIVVAVLGGAMLARGVELVYCAWFDSLTPAARRDRRIARDVEQAVARRQLQEHQAASKTESKGESGGDA